MIYIVYNTNTPILALQNMYLVKEWGAYYQSLNYGAREPIYRNVERVFISGPDSKYTYFYTPTLYTKHKFTIIRSYVLYYLYGYVILYFFLGVRLSE